MKEKNNCHVKKWKSLDDIRFLRDTKDTSEQYHLNNRCSHHKHGHYAEFININKEFNFKTSEKYSLKKDLKENLNSLSNAKSCASSPFLDKKKSFSITSSDSISEKSLNNLIKNKSIESKINSNSSKIKLVDKNEVYKKKSKLMLAINNKNRFGYLKTNKNCDENKKIENISHSNYEIDLRSFKEKKEELNDVILNYYLESPKISDRRGAICSRIDKFYNNRQLLNYMEYLLREDYIKNFLL